jgi:anti-sigma factor RsiW
MDGYLDGELDPLTSRKVEHHLRDCRKCEQRFEADMALAQAISRGTAYYKAPAELRQRVQSSLRDEIGTEAVHATRRPNQALVGNQQPSRRSFGFEPPWNWLALAAAIVLAAIIASNWLPVSHRRGSPDQFLATQLIASHVRSLMADHLTDVASSDQHTVKPWLDEKLDFAAPVPDLSSKGFPLIGGRLDYLDNHPVAALIYQRRKHYINLFIWPATRVASKAEKTMAHQGYHLLHWIDADFNYWAVSDVSASDLQTFKQSFEGQVVNR